jgi:hypothetical protein
MDPHPTAAMIGRAVVAAALIVSALVSSGYAWAEHHHAAPAAPSHCQREYGHSPCQPAHWQTFCR